MTSSLLSHNRKPSVKMAQCKQWPQWGPSAIERAVMAAFGRLGYSDPRSEQLEAAKQFVSGSDVFVSLPTGSGKSLCYGSIPYTYDSLCSQDSGSIVLVVSPLKALMLDQSVSFNARGLKSAYVGAEDDDGSVVERV